jgi:hypothetical protein
MDSFEAALRLNPNNDDAKVWIGIIERSEGFTRRKLKSRRDKVKVKASSSAGQEL